jgi:hypothetical protein
MKDTTFISDEICGYKTEDRLFGSLFGMESGFAKAHLRTQHGLYLQ